MELVPGWQRMGQTWKCDRCGKETPYAQDVMDRSFYQRVAFAGEIPGMLFSWRLCGGCQDALDKIVRYFMFSHSGDLVLAPNRDGSPPVRFWAGMMNPPAYEEPAGLLKTDCQHSG